MQEVLTNIIDSFASEGKVFTNEAQFQFDLAWALKEQGYDIRLEFQAEKREYIDILAIKNNVGTPIELKYKTKDKEETYSFHNGNSVTTKNQGAVDNGSYDFIKDIHRLEEVLQKSVIYDKGRELDVKEGFAIIITKEKKYYTAFENKDDQNGLFYHMHNGKSYYYWQQFSLAQGTVGGKLLQWIDPETGKTEEKGNHTTRDRKKGIQLSGKYTFEWKPYDLQGVFRPETSDFKYLIVKVK